MTFAARGDVPDWLNVSRETIGLLAEFLSLVEKWQPAINLVATSSLPKAWERHVLDSAQLFTFCPTDARHWADIGSGGGFPGIVIAILAKELMPNLRVSLVESDKRKSTFLVQAIRQFGLNAKVLTDRAESLPPLAADVLSARALTSLAALCGIAERHMSATGRAIFPKGAQVDLELADARTEWTFESELHVSKTDPAGRIVIIGNLRHA